MSLEYIAQAQNIKIQGIGKNISDKKIRLIEVNDLLSQYEKEIDSFVVKDSIFDFSITLDAVKILIIRIETYDYSFIAQPGKTYKLRILPFNFNINDSINTLLYRVNLPIIIENEKDNDLNRKIFDYNSIIGDFIIDNNKSLLVLRDRKVIDSLKNMISQFSKYNNDNYFKDYIEYSSAILFHSTNQISREEIKKKLFYNKPILYDNIGYMECFDYIYSNYYSLGNKYISTVNLDFWLAKKDYFSLVDSLGIDTLLRNEVFRELVLLKGLKEAFYSKNYIDYEVIDMLEKFIYETKFAEHKKIANNLIELLKNKSFNGQNPNSFELKSIEGKNISSSELTGKPTLISFVKINEVPSLRELNILNNFADSLKYNYNLLTITCDRNMETTYNFKVNSKIGSKYNWDFAHFDNKWDLLENFNIRVFPTFVLLNEDGKVLQNPMRSPSEGSLLQLIPKK